MFVPCCRGLKVRLATKCSELRWSHEVLTCVNYMPASWTPSFIFYAANLPGPTIKDVNVNGYQSSSRLSSWQSRGPAAPPHQPHPPHPPPPPFISSPWGPWHPARSQRWCPSFSSAWHPLLPLRRSPGLQGAHRPWALDSMPRPSNAAGCHPPGSAFLGKEWQYIHHIYIHTI